VDGCGLSMLESVVFAQNLTVKGNQGTGSGGGIFLG
jgi:hypothetical protein